MKGLSHLLEFSQGLFCGIVIPMARPLKKAKGNDRNYMELALEEAAKGLVKDEVPVGALVVHQGKVIGTGYNRREELQEPTSHAEILALREASASLGSWRLDDCTLYVTLEPCIMCTGAIIQARVSRLVFGCHDPKGGAVESLYRLCDDPRLNHSVDVTSGILKEQCARILSGFFLSLRQKNRVPA